MTQGKKTNIYPTLILLLLGSFLLFSAWSAFQAAGLGSKVTDADYYSKGLKYNTTLVEKRAASVLGWNMQPHLSGHTLELLLTGKKGEGVDRATGSLHLAVPGSAENLSLPLTEVTAGRYRVDLPESLHGSVVARLDVERDGARLNRQLLLNL